jgi:hypothetical protein
LGTQERHLEIESIQVEQGEEHVSHFLVVIFLTVVFSGQVDLHSLRYMNRLVSQSIQLVETVIHVSQGV